jgi:hypothetical protein
VCCAVRWRPSHLVELEHVAGGFDGGGGGVEGKEVGHGARDDALRALHPRNGVALPRPRLAVAEDADVVAVEGRLQQRLMSRSIEIK